MIESNRGFSSGSRADLARYFHYLGYRIGAEIGVAKGAFSETLCKYIPRLKLYCVDPWMPYKGNRRGGGMGEQVGNFEIATRKLSKYNTTLIRKKSTEALFDIPDESLDFVYIDGNHDYDYVMEDIIGWSRKVKRLGIVSGHDYYHFHNSGVVEAVDDYVRFHKLALYLTNPDVKKHSSDDMQPSWYFYRV